METKSNNGLNIIHVCMLPELAKLGKIKYKKENKSFLYLYIYINKTKYMNKII